MDVAVARLSAHGSGHAPDRRPRGLGATPMTAAVVTRSGRNIVMENRPIWPRGFLPRLFAGPLTQVGLGYRRGLLGHLAGPGHDTHRAGSFHRDPFGVN
jgi:hypothetical protein